MNCTKSSTTCSFYTSPKLWKSKRWQTVPEQSWRSVLTMLQKAGTEKIWRSDLMFLRILNMGSIFTRKHEMETWWSGTPHSLKDNIVDRQVLKNGKGSGSTKLKLFLCGQEPLALTMAWTNMGNQHLGISAKSLRSWIFLMFLKSQ